MKKFTLAALLFALGASSAMAGQIGAYGQVGVTQSRLGADASGLSRFDQNATGGSLSAGYVLNDTFSAEVAFTNYGSRTVGVTAGGVSVTTDVDMDSLGTYLRVNTPVYNGFQLYAKPGYVHARAKVLGDSVTKNHVDWAFGTEYKLTPSVALVGELHRIQNFIDSEGPMTSFNAGVKMSF